MADWLPFETAPKDGADIIVLSLFTCQQWKEWEFGTAYWCEDCRPAQWVVADGRVDAISGHYSDPIWWMPFNLPELPS